MFVCNGSSGAAPLARAAGGNRVGRCHVLDFGSRRRPRRHVHLERERRQQSLEPGGELDLQRLPSRAGGRRTLSCSPRPRPEFTSVNDLTDLIVQSVAIEDFQYQLSGNGISLDQQLTASSAVAGTPSVSLPVTLLQPNMPFTVGAGVELLMSGAITSDPGANLIKNGSGVLTLSNPANSWEFVAIDAGVLRLGAAGGLPDSALDRRDRHARPQRLRRNHRCPLWQRHRRARR